MKQRTFRLSPRSWQMYSYTAALNRAARPAAQALNAKLNECIAKGMTRQATRDACYKVMSQHSKQGACDTEPRAVLEDCLDKVYGREDY